MSDGIDRATEGGQFTRFISSCPICGSSAFEEVAAATERRCRTVMCRDCGLFFANPTLPVERLTRFYDEEFTGDAGSKAARKSVKPGKARRLELGTGHRMLPVIEAFAGVLDGKRILDLRSRKGFLARAMIASGARVTASDPMQLNIADIRARGIEAVPISVPEHSTLPMFAPGSFDAVTALTIHLLSHLPEPMQFLKRVHELLTPGGVLFLDEKDVLAPAKPVTWSVFDSGVGHLFHFTRPVVRAMLERAGFEVLSADHDTGRATTFRHVLVIARRPLLENRTAGPVSLPDPALIRRKLSKVNRWLKFQVPYHRTIRALKHSTKRLLRGLSVP